MIKPPDCFILTEPLYRDYSIDGWSIGNTDISRPPGLYVRVTYSSYKYYYLCEFSFKKGLIGEVSPEHYGMCFDGYLQFFETFIKNKVILTVSSSSVYYKCLNNLISILYRN